MVQASPLSADDWVDAAAAAFARAGLDAVRIEVLARELGATKGSFYWHFAHRQALVDAVLERWAQQTEDMIAEAETAGGDAAERLTALFAVVARRRGPGAGERALYGQLDLPGVAPVVTRVTERRIGSIAALLEELGHEPVEARARAVVALAAVLGHQQLVHATPHVEGGPSQQRRMLRTVLTMALHPEP